MALNIERFDPNIKNPGIKQGTGAYARGDVAKVGDFSAANEQIQKSIKEAGEAIAAMPPSLLQKIKGGVDEISEAMEGGGQNLVASIQEQVDGLIGNVALDESGNVIETRKTKERKGFLGIGERDAKTDVDKLTYKDLTRKQKKEVLNRIGYIKTIKDGISGPLSDFVKNNGDIDYTTIANNQEAVRFMDHVASRDGKFEIVFEDNKGNKAKGGYLKWNDGTKDNYLHNMQLQSAKGIFARGAGENRKAISDNIDTKIDFIDKKALAETNKAVDWNTQYQEDIVNARNAVLSEEGTNPAFIFNNMAGFKTTRYDADNPEHTAAVNNFLDTLIKDKLGALRTPKEKVITPPKNNNNSNNNTPPKPNLREITISDQSGRFLEVNTDNASLVNNYDNFKDNKLLPRNVVKNEDGTYNFEIDNWQFAATYSEQIPSQKEFETLMKDPNFKNQYISEISSQDFADFNVTDFENVELANLNESNITVDGSKKNIYDSNFDRSSGELTVFLSDTEDQTSKTQKIYNMRSQDGYMNYYMDRLGYSTQKERDAGFTKTANLMVDELVQNNYNAAYTVDPYEFLEDGPVRDMFTAAKYIQDVKIIKSRLAQEYPDNTTRQKEELDKLIKEYDDGDIMVMDKYIRN